MINLQEIKSYANANYNLNGWHVLVECWDDQDILAFCEKFEIKDTSHAIEALSNGLSIYDLNS